MHFYRPLLLIATILALGVVSLGAYVRLSDAGLGCPDWPGCYGHLLVPQTSAEQAAAILDHPDKPVETGKAWKEMTHRYFAGTLGLLILALTVLAWRLRIRPATTTLLAGTVVFQAMLGMWTVTLLLKPVIVTGHLLGGMTTLALLVWLWASDTSPRSTGRPIALRLTALAALLVVMVQIALGGWVSSNYAALACSDLPTCQGVWLPSMDFARAFTLLRELGRSGDGQFLPFEALIAIHWVHRMGALAVLMTVGGLSFQLIRSPVWRRMGLMLAGLLGLQLGLGIANVLLSLPLPLAVAHNLEAAMLLVAIVVINARLWR
jgi:cytochrome c oxidase assembly protein subunit 15